MNFDQNSEQSPSLVKVKKNYKLNFSTIIFPEFHNNRNFSKMYRSRLT